MGFEWDEDKRASSLAKHGVDFRRAAQIFGGSVIEFSDERRDYGERRIRCLGEIEGRVFSVVYTWRGPIRRIISARKANVREQRAYHTRHTRRS
ncbi:MAG: BrnT family toxin [Alphaproteobacteria bacterium]|nr:BrnT family toxin [Alphaproteobacteria bacterium]MBV9964358.1 BrnT family toxin [Alphaproteobacteria bacterium]